MPTRPDPTEEMAIQRLLAEYCHLCDDGDLDALLDRFTDDGTFAFDGREFTGRAAVRRWFEKTQGPGQRGKHIATNAVVDLLDADRATVVSDFLYLVRVDGALVPDLTGRYVDELRREGGRWRFHRREAWTLGG